MLTKDNGIRPIVVGELLRSLIAKVALAELGDGLADLQPLQVGVGGQGPWAQAAVLTVREWTKALRGGSPNVLVKVDIANAFNSINRSTCLQGIRSLAPGLSSWSTWCLSQQTHVCWDGVTIPCTTGVQQGDPCAPALFSAGIHGALEDIAHRYPVIRQVWYLDDGVLFGPPSAVEAALGSFESPFPSEVSASTGRSASSTAVLLLTRSRSKASSPTRKILTAGAIWESQ